jgi:hypothetical protein
VQGTECLLTFPALCVLQSVNITLALDDPMVVTYCNLNGTLITDPEACAAAVAPAPTPAPAPAPAA